MAKENVADDSSFKLRWHTEHRLDEFFLRDGYIYVGMIRSGR